METRLMCLENVPTERELISLLGETTYKYYCMICEDVIPLLRPNLETWDYAGRRGKYYHGYNVSKLSLSLDMYLRQESLSCGLHFYKRYFIRILKKKDSLNEQMQQCVNSALKLNEEYGGGYSVSLFLDGSMLQEIIKILNLAFPSLKIEYSPRATGL